MDNRIYGYVRVSTPRQNVERQTRNIKEAYPTAVIVKDEYTGITLTARLAGKQIGLPAGTKLVTKKSIAAKEVIQKHPKSFGGLLTDVECMKLTGIARRTYYKYKRELIISKYS